jgi:hypothetical protein
MLTVPNAIMGGAVLDSCASHTNAYNLAQAYGNLLPGASSNGNAADIKAEAANNVVLNSIGAYCRANGIGVMPEADRTDTSTASGSGVDGIFANWANATGIAVLSIVAIEDVQEVGTNPNLGVNEIRPQPRPDLRNSHRDHMARPDHTQA